MKRLARLVGGVFIVLILSIALVSCDDAILQHILQNGTQNEAQNGTQNNEQNEEQDEAEEDDDESEEEGEESEDEGDESEDEGDESEDEGDESEDEGDESEDEGDESDDENDESEDEGDESEDEGDESEDEGDESEDEGDESEEEGEESEDEGDESEDEGDESEDEGDESEDEGDESEDEGDESEDEGDESEDDEFNGLPRKGDFTYTGTPPTDYAVAVAASNEIKEETERIKRDLGQARENTETIEYIPENLLDMMGKAFGNVVVDYENDGYAGMEVFSVVLVGGVTDQSDEENALLKVDADSVEGFMFTRMLVNESDQDMETKTGMTAEFEIAGSEMGIDGKYKVELLHSVEGDDEEQEEAFVGTLTNVADGSEKQLIEDDLLGDWDQDGAEPHQRILTLFMDMREFDLVPKTLATQIFYPEITEDDTGKFLGLMSFYQEGDTVPMYLSFLWEEPDHEKYYVVYSSHEDYQTIVAINGVAYNFALP